MPESDPKPSGPRRVEVGPEALPLYCPQPETALWSAHPRVFLPIEDSGEELCPYCGTTYVLVQRST